MSGHAINRTLSLGGPLGLRGLGALRHNVAEAIAIFVVLFWSFLVNRIVTYRGL